MWAESENLFVINKWKLFVMTVKPNLSNSVLLSRKIFLRCFFFIIFFFMLCDTEPEARLKMIFLCAEEEWICIPHLVECISENFHERMSILPLAMRNNTMHTHIHSSCSMFSEYKWCLQGMYPFWKNTELYCTIQPWIACDTGLEQKLSQDMSYCKEMT